MNRWVVVFVLLSCGCGEESRRRDHADDSTEQTTTAGTTVAATSGAGGQGVGGAGSGATTGAGGSAPLQPGDLVITEIMNNPAAVLDSVGEWFEIYNASDQTVDLDGLLIVHQPGTSTPVTIDASVPVAPHSYAVLGINGDELVNGGIAVDYVYASEVSLHNAADYLAIERSDTVVIDETSWDELSGLDPDGSSRNLDAQSISASMNDDDTHYCAATTLIAASTDHGTPGAPNDACP